MSVLSCSQSDAFVRRDAPTTPNILVSVQKHMDEFKNCIDQTLAKTVDEVNVKQIEPVFQVLGDHLDKLSRAVSKIIIAVSHFSSEVFK